MADAQYERLGSFQILEIPQNVGRKARMLGAVVPSTSCTNPFDKYAPYWASERLNGKEADKKALEELEVLMKSFWTQDKEQGVKLEDVTARRGEATDKAWKVQATKALEVYGSNAVNEDVWIEAGEVEIYTMDNPARAVPTRLSVCEPWKDELQDLCRDDDRADPKYYMITGAYTCKNMRVGWAKQKAKAGGAALGVPGEAIAAAAGAPIPNEVAQLLDVSARYDAVRESDTEVSARIPQEILFGFRYHVLNITFEEQAQPNVLVRGFHKVTGKSIPARKPILRTIKDISLGPPVRGPGMASAYADASKDLLYWEEPDYVEPDIATPPQKAGAVKAD